MALADLPPGQHADRVRDHWWWRPGWRVGLRFSAYLTTDGPAAPHVQAVKATEPRPTAVRITHVDVIDMHRDQQMYEWSSIARLPLQASARHHMPATSTEDTQMRADTNGLNHGKPVAD